MNSRSISVIAWTFGLLIVVTGCGDDGPERYGLSGNITYDGNPIAFGWIVFAPESGPGGTANIENGQYETPEGFGTIGGMHTLEVVAFDGVAIPDPDTEGGMNTAGKLMFSHSFEKDIPKESTTFDIEISREDIESSN